MRTKLSHASRRWRTRWLASLIVIAGAGLALIPVLQAVHDTGAFELDGNAVSVFTDDWDVVCHQVLTSDCSTTFNTNGATAVSFVAEANLNSSIFTGGGSKDPQDISNWAWKDGAGGLPDKDNLLHSFAARYSLPATDPGTWQPGNDFCGNGTGDLNRNGVIDGTEVIFDSTIKCEVLFFGSDRLDNSGDAQQGFWFFQNKVGLGNNPVGGGTGFTGLHKTGDLLIISDFSNGGTTSTISVYKWNTAVSGNLQLLATSTAANCASAAPRDGFCGIVNSSNGTIAPWPFTDKSGNSTYLQGEFYEGGVNLTTLGLGTECFSSVASETRASTSTTATLKDFVLGSFGKCETGLTTVAKDGAGADIPTNAQDGKKHLSIGSGSVTVKDAATLTISGIQNWTGTLKFYLCGPSATSCSDSATDKTQIGAAAGITVTNATSQPIASSVATVTSAGTYCWAATFKSGTNNVPDAVDDGTNECFTVDPVSPGVSTNATDGPVSLGTALSDTASVSPTANKPGTPVINPTTPGGVAGGTVTFRLYGPQADPANPVCSASTKFGSDNTVPLVGGNSASSGSFTPTKAGTYVFVATYSGDSPNTGGPSSNGCGDSDETVVVSPNQPGISTNATAEDITGEPSVALGSAISDSATITGLATPSNGVYGTITFKAYGPHQDKSTCTTLAYTSVLTINVNDTGTFNSANGDGGVFTPGAIGNYNWIASYTPGAGDVNNKSVTGACGDAHEGSVVIQLTTAISTAQTMTIKDSATITAPSGAGNLLGTLRFRLYNNATCDPGAGNVNLLYDSITLHPTGIAVSGASPQTVESDVKTFTTTQNVLSWLVQYTSTNQGHTNVESSCNTEHANLTIVNQ